jgi:ribosomal protein L7/L12
VNKATKQQFIDTMAKNFTECSAAYLINMCGMTVAESTELRRLLRRNKAICKVVQNRLVKVSGQQSKVEGLESFLKGPVAIVFAHDDPAPLSRLLMDFSKKSKNLGLKAVVLDKKTYGAENFIKLAYLPPKKVLLGQLLSTLQSPVSRLLLVLSMSIRSLLSIVNKIQQHKSEGKDLIGGTAMSNLSREDVINYILGLPVLDLVQFIKEIEEKTGISAAAMVAPVAGIGMAVPTSAADAKPAEEEKTEFDVMLKSVGDKKINVIKVLRDLTNLGLKEAKELIDNVPRLVKEGVSKEEADSMKKKFEEAGATVEVK